MRISAADTATADTDNESDGRVVAAWAISTARPWTLDEPRERRRKVIYEKNILS